MRFQELIRFTATSLPGVVISLQLAAQEPPAAQHHHYTVINIGSFGGLRSHINTGGENFSGISGYAGISQDLNNAGTLVGWADTPALDPYAASNPEYCFNGDCYVSHAFVWQSGVIRDLGTLPNGLSSATSWVSANGLIAGASQNGELDPQMSPGYPEDRAVLWRDGRIMDLGVLPEPEGGYESGAEAVNSRGQVVGWAINRVPDPYSMAALSELFNNYEPVEYYQERAFLWQDGVMQDLGTLATGTDAYAVAINEQGQVIGFSYTNSTPNQVSTPCAPGSLIPTQDPFLWEHGHMIDLGSLGGTCGFPTWISNSGQVVGQSDLPGDQVTDAFLWTKAGGMQDLGTLGGTSAEANMVNDSGEVVGGALLADDSQTDAFLWDGKMHDLGALNGCGTALSINARGQVVGNWGSNVCQQGGFLWEDGGPMVDLNTLVSSDSDLTVSAAVEINDSGVIIGAATDTNGNPSAIVLIPCDENHPGLDGCDYSLVDARSVTQPAMLPNESRDAPAVGRRGMALGYRRGAPGLTNN